MTWPQIVVLCIMLFGSLYNPIVYARDRRHSSAAVAIYTVVLLAMQAAFAWVLHCGGFW